MGGYEEAWIPAGEGMTERGSGFPVDKFESRGKDPRVVN